MKQLIVIALLFSSFPAYAQDRACTKADVARFESMFGGKGSYHTDPRFQITIHYLGTSVSGGVCHVNLRLAN